jgi:hypothetical protein
LATKCGVVIVMDREVKRAVLMARIARLVAHQETVKNSDGIEREIDKARAELLQLEQRTAAEGIVMNEPAVYEGLQQRFGQCGGRQRARWQEP